MGNNKILQWIIDNWKDISVFCVGVFALFKGVLVAYKQYKKLAEPIKTWIKKMDDAAEQLRYNGGSSMRDMVSSTNSLVKGIETNLTTVMHRQEAMRKLSSDAIFECNHDGYCTSANDSLCELFGSDPTRMQGYGWLGYIKDNDVEREYWESAVQSDNEISREYVIQQGKDRNREIKAKYIATIKRDNEGNILNITGRVSKL